jgi:hypothetical protein
VIVTLASWSTYEGAVERDFLDLRHDARAGKGIRTNSRPGTQDTVPESARAVANDCRCSLGHERSNARRVVLVKVALHDMRDGNTGKSLFERVDQIAPMFRRHGRFGHDQPLLVGHRDRVATAAAQ